MSSPLVAAVHPTVTFNPGSGIVNTNFERFDGSFNIAFEITTTTGSTTVTIRPGENGQVIHNLAILHEASGNIADIRIAKSSDGTKTFSGLRTMLWSTTNTGNLVLRELRTTGDVGRIEVNSWVDTTNDSIDIGGNLTGPITLFDTPSGSSSQQFEARIGGNLLGNIDGPTGSSWNFDIDRLVVDGAIGTSGTPVNIWPRGDIRRISCTGAIYADIDATKYVSTGDIGHLSCGGALLSGSVAARKLNNIAVGLDPGIFITSSTGDLDADITLTQPMDREIRIGRSFLANRSINLPTNGLTGQIIFNAANNSGAWSNTAHVKINGTNLSGEPYYTTTASTIGGGSAGLATFHLHDESCSPANGATFNVRHRDLTWTGEGDPPCITEPFEAILRFYGPVELVGSSPHATVETWDGANWNAVPWTVVTEIVSATNAIARCASSVRAHRVGRPRRCTA